MTEPSALARFGDLLRRHRLAAGLSQEELAERAGLSRRGISDLERGVRRPDPGTALGLAGALELVGEVRVHFVEARQVRRRAPSDEMAVANNLPTALSSFVGRERELDEVRNRLAAARLLTLTGTGGVGKTRLAIEAARGLAAEDGVRVFLVELAAITDSAAVAREVAGVLGIPEQPGWQTLDTLKEALRSQERLLILDNCEQVLQGCAELANALLGGCPNVRILATSRERLGITGEAVWPLAPLSAVDPAKFDVSDDDLEVAAAASDAARLFIDRAHLVMPAFAATGEHLRAVARITHELDGMPLALELAAAQIRVLSAVQIAERLTDELDLLTYGNRAAPDRQKTMRAALDWSYRLLLEPERRLFERLSVFASGWTLEAAQAICVGPAILSHAVPELLGGLVQKSLVSVQLELDGKYRYRLLEPVRQYASERLAEKSGDTSDYRLRHAEYFLALRRRAETSARDGSYSTGLECDNDNVRAALRWAVESGHARVYRAARVIVLDARQRVLLLRYQGDLALDPNQPGIRSFWVTPGGVLEPEESFEVAALRELEEETGITGVELSPCVWVSAQAYFWQGEPALREDHYFIARVREADVDTTGIPPAERATHPEFRWWTTTELAATSDTISPPGFAGLLEQMLDGNMPTAPIRIGADGFVEAALAPATDAQVSHLLTRREQEVAMLVAAGRSNREIAETLVIAEGTVEVHLKHILSKLGFRSRSQVAVWFAQQQSD